MLIEIVSYLLVAFAPNGLFFTLFTMMVAFGAGFGPAVQSVALGLYTLRGGTESGKLFGAMSVVSSLWYVFFCPLISYHDPAEEKKDLPDRCSSSSVCFVNKNENFSYSSQIIGPTVFGVTYVKTVATFPKAIFFLSVGAVSLAFFVLTFVRLPEANVAGGGGGGHDLEETVVEDGRHELEDTLFDPEVPLIIVDDTGGKKPASPTSSVHPSPTI